MDNNNTAIYTDLAIAILLNKNNIPKKIEFILNNNNPLKLENLTPREKEALFAWVKLFDRDINAIRYGMKLIVEGKCEATLMSLYDPIKKYIKNIDGDTLRRSIDTIIELHRLINKYNPEGLKKVNSMKIYRGVSSGYNISPKVGDIIELDRIYLSSFTTDQNIATKFNKKNHGTSIQYVFKPKYTTSKFVNIPSNLGDSYLTKKEQEILVNFNKDAKFKVKSVKSENGLVFVEIEEHIPLKEKVKYEISHMQKPKVFNVALSGAMFFSLYGHYKDDEKKYGKDKAGENLINAISLNWPKIYEEQKKRYVNPNDNFILQGFENFNAFAVALSKWVVDGSKDMVNAVLNGYDTFNYIMGGIEQGCKAIFK